MKKFYVWEKETIDVGSLVNDNKKERFLFFFSGKGEKTEILEKGKSNHKKTNHYKLLDKIVEK